jgi:hypothetical protein
VANWNLFPTVEECRPHQLALDGRTQIMHVLQNPTCMLNKNQTRFLVIDRIMTNVYRTKMRNESDTVATINYHIESNKNHIVAMRLLVAFVSRRSTATPFGRSFHAVARARVWIAKAIALCCPSTPLKMLACVSWTGRGKILESTIGQSQ